MSNLSSYTVTLQNSANYRRVACLVYGCVFLLMASLSWPITIKVVVIAILLLPLVHIIRNPKPQSCCLTLHYSHPIWRLQENQNPEIAYESLRILIDTDLFFLLRLWDDSKQRLLVVFHDQLTDEDHHLFRVLEKIH